MSWEPASFTELTDALQAGTIVESASIEFKAEITNEKLARSLASLAINGGTLLIGVDDAGQPVPVQLSGQTERIDQVAWSRINPGVSPRVRTLEDPAHPGLGIVVVSVDASPQAPHMANDRYPTRVGTTTGYLSDGDVARLMDRRAQAARDASDELAAYQERDPASDNGTAHLFVVAVPRLAPGDLVVTWTGSGSRSARLTQDVLLPVADDVPNHWFPKIGVEISTFANRGDGVAFVNALDRTRRPTGAPERAAELEIAENGTIRVFTARASEHLPGGGHNMFPESCVGLAMQALHAARRLAAATSYRGPWACGIAITDLEGLTAFPANWLSTSPSVYPDTEYKEFVAATAGDIEQPERVGWRLLGRFLRALNRDTADLTAYGLPPSTSDGAAG